ncbi:MAG: acetate kinase, partial [Candidatus Margulisiibacteriota bacterium]
MILALNCGSSSVKYQLYGWSENKVICKGVVERVGHAHSYVLHERTGHNILKKEGNCPDHKLAIKFILKILTDPEIGVIPDINEIRAVGHRVVHGGDKFARSVIIDAQVLKTIKEVKDLAPLHNPPNITGIESAQQVLPNVPQVAVFDTAFHQTIPDYAYMYAVPKEWYREYGIRRYGFHGTSHLYVSKRAVVLLKKAGLIKKNKPVRIITLHIGNGVSIAAVKNGESVDTSMGFTPLAGAIMGTRSGDVDPAIVPYMSEKLHISAEKVVEILNKKSGLLGITEQYTDRRDIIKAAKDGDTACQLAIEMETYRLKKYVGAYAAAMGGVDAIVFTAGVGEKSPSVREKTLHGLEYMGVEFDKVKNRKADGKREELDIALPGSKVRVFIIPTNEEIVFIED